MIRSLCTAIWIGLIISTPARAGTIVGGFTATVTGTDAIGTALPGVINVGDQVTGAFQFTNSGQAPHTSLGGGVNEDRYFSLTPGSFMRVSIGNLTWETKGVSLGVRNDSPNLQDDLLTFGLQNYSVLQPISFPGALQTNGFTISLFDVSSPWELLDSTALPNSASDLNLPAATIRTGTIGAVQTTSLRWQVRYRIDEITFEDAVIVPEPSSFVIACVGALALAGIAWRRSLTK